MIDTLDYTRKIVRRFELKMTLLLFFLPIGSFLVNANNEPSPALKLGLDLNGVTLMEVPNEISIKKIQDIQIQGIVLDDKTGEPIPYCNIAIGSFYSGTATNELGEFVMDINALPVQLVFSHINYEKFQLDITAPSNLTIRLVPLTNMLEEVVVVDSKQDKYAFELAKKVYQKADQNSNIRKYGRAFYRQKSKNGDAYSEFSEIIYDLHYTSKGIGDWEIMEGRYALKPQGVQNKNYTLLSRLLTPLQPATDDIIFPLHPDFESFYDVRIVEHLASGADKIAVLWFKPKKDLQIPIFDAEVYVNTKSHDILKITGNLTNDNLKLVQLSEKSSSWKDYAISYEIAFRQDSVLKSVIDYVKIDQEFDYYKKDSLEFHTSSTSNLTFFEHYSPTARKKLGGQFRKNKSDWQKLDEIGYNEQFWQDNPIIKRTPSEDEVIASFEKNEGFGSIFLNSRNRLMLMQSNLKGDPFIKELGENVNLYNNYNPVEKVYLHTDKDLFSAGEDVWYSSYVVLGSYHHFSTGSKVLYVDLIGPDNKIVLSQTNEIIEGKCYGSLKLPEHLPTGSYQIRSYTDWMRNFDQEFFFTYNIDVLNKGNKPLISSLSEDKIDLQFFPEGGHSVDGLISIVAFKAIGSDGLDREIQGRIMDSQGKFVAALGTLVRGSGFFSFKPKAGEQYTAVLKDGTTYNLPQIMQKGYAMTVNNVNPKSIQVKIQATPLLKKKPFYVTGHLNNKKYYQGKFEFEDQGTVSFEIPKNGIPSGVMTLTLFDQDKKPWCERVVFVNNQDELVITAKIDHKKIESREKITMDVHVTDTYGRPISAELSLAVTDKGQIVKNQGSSNILTHLLLQSDIKGHINNPGLLFKNQKRSTLHSLDLVMLTHGWRKFPWREIKKDPNVEKEFSFSKGLDLAGTAKNQNGKPMANATLNVIAKSKEDLEMFSAITSHDGKFSIPYFNFRDSTQIVFNALQKGKTPVDVQISLDNDKNTLPLPNFNGRSTEKDTKEIEAYSDFSATRKKMRLIYDFQDATELEEVVITQNKTETTSTSAPSALGQTPDATLFTKDTRESSLRLMDYITRFAAVTVLGSWPNVYVKIRDGGTPLWVLNGIPLSKGGPQGIGVPAAVEAAAVPFQIASMDISNVQRVELLKGPSASIWGLRGANGVFLVYTKRGSSETIDRVHSPSFSIFGHAAKREFYSPNYSVKLDRHSLADYRSTLYWNPSFVTDTNGNARLIFYNSDNAKQFQVEIEGLSNYGTPGAFLKTFGKKGK